MNALRLVTVLVFAGAVLSGCDRAPQPSAAPAADDAAQPKPAALAEATRFIDWLRKDRAAVIHQVALKDYELQSRLLEFSGLTEELGSPERANAALRDLMVAVESSSKPPDEAEWTRIGSGDEVSGAFNVAQATVEIAGVALNFDKTYGEGADSHTGNKSEGGTGEMVVSDGSITYTSTKDVTASGLTGKMGLRLKVNVCPDAAGEIQLELTGKSSVTSSKSGRGANTEFSATAKRTVNDDAAMSGLDIHVNLQSAEFGGGSGVFVDMDQDLSVARGLMGTKVNRRSSKARDADVATTESLLQTIYVTAIAATELTRSVWENGKCVRIDTESAPGERSKLKPSTSFSLMARPRSKLDGSAVGGAVIARLTGGSRLDPAGSKVKADAKFAYTGPAEKNETASVAFESRSKRGIGLTSLEFDTKAAGGYLMQGGAGEIHFKGEVCDLAEQFFLRADNPLHDVTIRFDPQFKKYSYSGSMSGYDDKGRKYTFHVEGKGTFELQRKDDVATGVTASGSGTVQTPYGILKGEGSEKYTLTPLPEGATCTAATD